MKEITRIHIAKITYEAELEAKKQLEAYLASLEAYSNDADILEDVEIRMTEILAERGVKTGGVITQKDVDAIKEQLGEPRDFMGDGDIAVVPNDEEQVTAASSRKFYRDTDHAVLGGVLSGMAIYFKMSTTLMRVLFIVLALISFGTALLIYVVLWIAVPPARTAADKLQMAGRPVTVSSIRQMNETIVESDHPVRSNNGAARVLLAILGVFCTLGAIGAAVLTIIAVATAFFGSYNHYIQMGDGAGFFIAAFILAVLSGILLTVLLSLGAYASFAMRATKRVVICMIVVTILGILSFATALGLAQYAGARYEDAVKANTKEVPLAIPAGTDKATALQIQGDVQVQYVVTTEAPKAVVRTIGQQDISKDTHLHLEGEVLKLSGHKKEQAPCKAFWCHGPFVTIYGPALDRVVLDKKATLDYSGEAQPNMEATVKEDATMVISKGVIDTFTMKAASDSEFMASEASVTNVNLELEAGADVELGTVGSLKISALTSCPSGRKASVEAAGVSTNTFSFNDKMLPLERISMACVRVDIENND